MTDEVFNICSFVGIILTFLVSAASVIVSIKSLRETRTAAKRTDHINSITASREKWSYALRENATLYFTQIERMCCGPESDLMKIYSELTRYHFAVRFLLSPTHKIDKDICKHMDALHSEALKLVMKSKVIETTPDSDVEAEIQTLKRSILRHQEEALNGIEFLIEREWKREKDEVTNQDY